MVTDAEAEAKLIDTVIRLINDDQQLASLSENIAKLAQLDSASRIADIILNEIKK